MKLFAADPKKKNPEQSARVSPLRLYRHYLSIVLRSAMQYKVSFLLASTGQFLVSFNAFLGVYFLFLRFESVRGYTYGEVLLCFSIVLLQFSLAECIARGFDSFSGIVRQGEFDRILVRPRSLCLQVLGSRFELSRIGRMLQAVLMFAYGASHAGVLWTWPRILDAALMIVFGAVLFSALFLIYAALCFFTLEGLEFMNVLTDGAREHGKYPIDIYGTRFLRLCTYVVPYALVQTYPLQFLLGRTDRLSVLLDPFGVLGFLAFAYGLWRLGVRKYTSAGS